LFREAAQSAAVANTASESATKASAQAQKAVDDARLILGKAEETKEKVEALSNGETLKQELAAKLAKDSTFQEAIETQVGSQKITFLENSKIKIFVNHYGELNTAASLQDQRVNNLTDDGIEQERNGIVPLNARGVIVRVMIARSSGDGSAHFQVADSHAVFSYTCISNYCKNWAGGIAFCPFYAAQKFKWRLASNGGSEANKHIGCIGEIIGWF
jgi:hypothetical protein